MMLTPLPTPQSAVRIKKLAKGETLFSQGDTTFAIFFVRRGRIRLVRYLDDGSSVMLYLAHNGETFSEAALFAPVYHCNAIADVESEVEIHPKKDISQALNEHPEAARKFMMHLAHQVIDLRSRLEIRNIRSASERVVQFLQLAVGGTNQSVTFERSLKDVAGEIGLAHEAFYRTLAKLEANGRIVRQGRTITLLTGGLKLPPQMSSLGPFKDQV